MFWIPCSRLLAADVMIRRMASATRCALRDPAHRPPLEILAELRAIEQEILQGIEELEGMLQ